MVKLEQNPDYSVRLHFVIWRFRLAVKLESLRNRVTGKLRTAEWRKHVPRNWAFPVLRDIFSAEWRKNVTQERECSVSRNIMPSCCVRCLFTFRPDEGPTLEKSAFQIFLGGNSTFINSFEISKFMTVKRPSQLNVPFPIARPTHFFRKVKKKKNQDSLAKEANILIYKHTILFY